MKNAGLEIDVAEDGHICIDMLTSSPAGTYNLILMDIQMPNLNGYAATKCIRELYDKQMAEIPIVALTAKSFPEDIAKSLEVGMNAHICKPVSKNQLLETVRQYLK